MNPAPFSLVVPAPLWRRLAAAVYDGLLLVALWFVTSALELVVRGALGWPANPHATRALLFGVGLAFCGWFWTHGGQTLGMRVWRLQVRRTDGAALGWPTAAVRYALAWVAWLPAALGVLWCALDPRRRAWHDLGSGTEVVLLPKASAAAATPRGAP